MLLSMMLLCAGLDLRAQAFFNLTADDVRLDSVLPRFSHTFVLGRDYADSLYEVSIDYPEFVDMTPTDVVRYERISGRPLPEMPQVEQFLAVSRKRGVLSVSMVPLVMRNGRYQKLVSFSLSLHAQPALASRYRGARWCGGAGVRGYGERYREHSVLAGGAWAKIRVPETGVYHLSDAFIRKAGFSHPAKVKVYGYGGAMQPEALTADYLALTDDLQEVPTCTIGGRRLFRAIGPVTWASETTVSRTRNPYSDYGYYFLTESDDEPLTMDSAAWVGSFYPAADDYHTLHEVDNYAWYHSGRNLYERTVMSEGGSLSVSMAATAASGRLAVVLTSDGVGRAQVLLNDSLLGTLSFISARGEYEMAISVTGVYDIDGSLKDENTIVLRQEAGGTAQMRLDYVALASHEPAPLTAAAACPEPEYVCRITNQDHHADGPVDMVIIIPTSQKLLAQAERLKSLHEQHDSLRVRIVPADELYNEFSSGTPDASAYRRYMKMLYDRAETEADMPRYLLLFGDAAWDNRMLSSEWRQTSPDDFLLCFESENSFHQIYSYVSEDYFAMLDDGELTSDYRGKADVGVGRLPVRTADEAKIIVDKIEAYLKNQYAGAWQNTLCFMADDGNSNGHMKTAENIVRNVTDSYSGYRIKKVYWDAYTREASSTGNSYPDVERLLKQQMQDGALVFNYSGHGAPYTLSHEQVLKLADFAAPAQNRLPLWLTASCDIAPFDTQEDNIGETAMLNPTGGAVAFIGTTRTVYMDRNERINIAFMKRVLGTENGRRNSVGDALRLAKNDLTDAGSDVSQNKLHYVLLGDPALVLAAPTLHTIIDSINGLPTDEAALQQLAAGSKVTVVGHVEGAEAFSGVVNATMFDTEETIVCKLNEPTPTDATETPFEFSMRPNTIYAGSDSVRNGRFSLTFAIPRDISYSDESGLLITHVISNDRQLAAHGEQTGFKMGGGQQASDGVGPSVYCYLNSEAFTNGGTVNSTPYFYAELNDRDGINAAGSGIGHDLELTIDGDMSQTYILNNYFQYDFGDYRSGVVGYSIPTLTDGPHRLRFRAWDVLNNSTVAELSFVVDASQAPVVEAVGCKPNPATAYTRFFITHDRTGSEMDVTLEVYDFSGRRLWEKHESGLPTDRTYSFDWDLTGASGNKLQTGVYLYRILVSSGGRQQISAAKKLIILGNN